MSDSQRRDFKKRAANLFNCGEAQFRTTQDDTRKIQQLEAWSGDLLPMSAGTVELLPKLTPVTPCTKKNSAVFGIITSDIQRISPLLDDLRAASASFIPFIVVFVNTATAVLATEVESEIKKRMLQGG